MKSSPYTTASSTLLVSDSIGEISVEIITPGAMKAIITFAHGAGAGMKHPFMTRMSEELAALGYGTLRFNFPYMENKKKRPDVPAVAQKTVKQVIQHAHALYPELPIVGSGKSFGGRMTSQYLSGECPSFVKGIIFFGFPLHPAGTPSVERADHLKSIRIPMLFLQGTRDTLASVDLIEKVSRQLPTSTLEKFDGADHSFKAGKQDLIPVLASKADEWMKNELEVRG